MEDELVLLLADLHLAVDDVGGELEAVGDHGLVVDVEALEKFIAESTLNLDDFL